MEKSNKPAALVKPNVEKKPQSHSFVSAGRVCLDESVAVQSTTRSQHSISKGYDTTMATEQEPYTSMLRNLKTYVSSPYITQSEKGDFPKPCVIRMPDPPANPIKCGTYHMDNTCLHNNTNLNQQYVNLPVRTSPMKTLEWRTSGSRPHLLYTTTNILGIHDGDRSTHSSIYNAGNQTSRSVRSILHDEHHTYRSPIPQAFPAKKQKTENEQYSCSLEARTHQIDASHYTHTCSSLLCPVKTKCPPSSEKINKTLKKCIVGCRVRKKNSHSTPPGYIPTPVTSYNQPSQINRQSQSSHLYIIDSSNTPGTRILPSELWKRKEPDRSRYDVDHSYLTGQSLMMLSPAQSVSISSPIPTQVTPRYTIINPAVSVKQSSKLNTPQNYVNADSSKSQILLTTCQANSYPAALTGNICHGAKINVANKNCAVSLPGDLIVEPQLVTTTLPLGTTLTPPSSTSITCLPIIDKYIVKSVEQHPNVMQKSYNTGNQIIPPSCSSEIKTSIPLGSTSLLCDPCLPCRVATSTTTYMNGKTVQAGTGNPAINASLSGNFSHTTFTFTPRTQHDTQGAAVTDQPVYKPVAATAKFDKSDQPIYIQLAVNKEDVESEVSTCTGDENSQEKSQDIPSSVATTNNCASSPCQIGKPFTISILKKPRPVSTTLPKSSVQTNITLVKGLHRTTMNSQTKPASTQSELISSAQSNVKETVPTSLKTTCRQQQVSIVSPTIHKRDNWIPQIKSPIPVLYDADVILPKTSQSTAYLPKKKAVTMLAKKVNSDLNNVVADTMPSTAMTSIADTIISSANELNTASASHIPSVMMSPPHDVINNTIDACSPIISNANNVLDMLGNTLSVLTSRIPITCNVQDNTVNSSSTIISNSQTASFAHPEEKNNTSSVISRLSPLSDMEKKSAEDVTSSICQRNNEKGIIEPKLANEKNMVTESVSICEQNQMEEKTTTMLTDYESEEDTLSATEIIMSDPEEDVPKVMSSLQNCENAAITEYKKDSYITYRMNASLVEENVIGGSDTEDKDSSIVTCDKRSPKTRPLSNKKIVGRQLCVSLSRLQLKSNETKLIKAESPVAREVRQLIQNSNSLFEFCTTKPGTCIICCRSFRKMENLQNHMRHIHHIANYKLPKSNPQESDTVSDLGIRHDNYFLKTQWPKKKIKHPKRKCANSKRRSACLFASSSRIGFEKKSPLKLKIKLPKRRKNEANLNMSLETETKYLKSDLLGEASGSLSQDLMLSSDEDKEETNNMQGDECKLIEKEFITFCKKRRDWQLSNKKIKKSNTARKPYADKSNACRSLITEDSFQVRNTNTCIINKTTHELVEKNIDHQKEVIANSNKLNVSQEFRKQRVSGKKEEIDNTKYRNREQREKVFEHQLSTQMLSDASNRGINRAKIKGERKKTIIDRKVTHRTRNVCRLKPHMDNRDKSRDTLFEEAIRELESTCMPVSPGETMVTNEVNQRGSENMNNSILPRTSVKPDSVSSGIAQNRACASLGKNTSRHALSGEISKTTIKKSEERLVSSLKTNACVNNLPLKEKPSFENASSAEDCTPHVKFRVVSNKRKSETTACLYCQETVCKPNMKQHCKQLHPFTCSRCKWAFETKAEKGVHNEAYHPKQHVCELCQKRYATSKRFMHHLLGAEHNRLEQVQINAWETMIKVQNKRLAKARNQSEAQSLVTENDFLSQHLANSTTHAIGVNSTSTSLPYNFPQVPPQMMHSHNTMSMNPTGPYYSQGIETYNIPADMNSDTSTSFMPSSHTAVQKSLINMDYQTHNIGETGLPPVSSLLSPRSQTLDSDGSYQHLSTPPTQAWTSTPNKNLSFNMLEDDSFINLLMGYDDGYINQSPVQKANLCLDTSSGFSYNPDNIPPIPNWGSASRQASSGDVDGNNNMIDNCELVRMVSPDSTQVSTDHTDAGDTRQVYTDLVSALTSATADISCFDDKLTQIASPSITTPASHPVNPPVQRTVTPVITDTPTGRVCNKSPHQLSEGIRDNLLNRQLHREIEDSLRLRAIRKSKMSCETLTGQREAKDSLQLDDEQPTNIIKNMLEL